MEMEIKRIAKKKKPTGDEVGKTLLYMLASDTINSKNQDYKPTITQAKFDEMVYSFSKEEDYIEYSFYKELYEVILSAKLFADGMEQQTLRGLVQLHYMTQHGDNAEREKTAKEKLPVIMTQKQYQEYLDGKGEFVNADYATKQRIKVGGIAVVQGENAPHVNKAGYYVEPSTYVVQQVTIERISQDKNYLKRVEVIYNNLVLTPMVFLAGYNTLLDILAQVCGVEELKEIKHNPQMFANHIEMVNTNLEVWDKNMYGDEPEKQKKRALMHDMFPHMPSNIAPLSEKTQEKVKKEIEKLKAEGGSIHNLQEFNQFVEKLIKGG